MPDREQRLERRDHALEGDHPRAAARDELVELLVAAAVQARAQVGERRREALADDDPAVAVRAVAVVAVAPVGEGGVALARVWMQRGDVCARRGETALRRDFEARWSTKTPRPVGSFTDESRFRPVSMEYANGTVLNFVPGITTATFSGERGTMTISRSQFATDPIDLVTDRPDPEVSDKWEGSGHVARPHLQNWLDCIQSRGIPNASIETGHRSVTVCHLANLVREMNRPLRWNPATEEFMDDDIANAMLDRPRRRGFELP